MQPGSGNGRLNLTDVQLSQPQWLTPTAAWPMGGKLTQMVQQTPQKKSPLGRLA